MDRKRVILAGGSGFLGRALARVLNAKGLDVIVLSRKQAVIEGASVLLWDGVNRGAWCDVLSGSLAIINLSGRSVDCRYTQKNKRAIMNSRLQSTAILGECIATCTEPPKYWINTASATIYADTRGDLPANTEAHGQIGEGFSVDVCRAWEAEFYKHDLSQTERFCLRVAITLGVDGGALIPLRRLAQFGLGGAQGDGQQFISWLHVDDFVGIVEFVLNGKLDAGVYNCAAPHPVTNSEFMSAMRAVVGRRFGMPMPRFLLDIGAVLIRTEPELILKSRKVVPTRLLDADYRFKYSRVDSALWAIEADIQSGER